MIVFMYLTTRINVLYTIKNQCVERHLISISLFSCIVVNVYRIQYLHTAVHKLTYERSREFLIIIIIIIIFDSLKIKI